MRRIYYSSNFFRPTNISCFRYLRILSFSYYSVIKVQLHCLTSERCPRRFQEHRSLFNTIRFFGDPPSGRRNSTRHTPPGRGITTCFRAVHSSFLCLRSVQQISFYSNNNVPATSVEMAGFEPATFALQRRCSPTELHPQTRWVEWA